MGEISERSVASGVSLSFGLVNFTGNLYNPVTKNKDEDLKMVCPECVSPMTQEYKCPNGHPNLLPSEVGRAKEVDDTLVLLTPAQVEKAKESKLAKNQMEIRIHPAEEVLPKLVTSNLTYVFYPTGPTMSYGLLFDLIVAHPELVFLGMIHLRSDKLMRLVPGLDGKLLMQEVAWFSDVKELPTPVYEYPEKLREQAEILITSLTEPFDPEDYTKDSREAMLALVVEASGGTPAPVSKPAKKPDDLADKLAASLAAATKKPRKKAPAKKPVEKAS